MTLGGHLRKPECRALRLVELPFKPFDPLLQLHTTLNEEPHRTCSLAFEFFEYCVSNSELCGRRSLQAWRILQESQELLLWTYQDYCYHRDRHTTTSSTFSTCAKKNRPRYSYNNETSPFNICVQLALLNLS
jgi:hypothetical protein